MASVLRTGPGSRLLPALAFALTLAGCLPMGGADPASPITGPEVETTTLPPAGGAAGPAEAAPTATAPAASGAAPSAQTPGAASAAPSSSAPASPASAVAPVVRSPAQLACEADGGRYVRVGSGPGMACQRPTRDSGKSCTRKSDCQGDCLARSGTCAPLTPLFGCNEILQDDGRRVSLCID